MAAFGTPITLASYPGAAQRAQSSGPSRRATPSSSSLHGLHASSYDHVRVSPVHGSVEPQAVAAVQGAALWIYDLSTNNPVDSFTIGPSTKFSTQPLCFYADVNDDAQSGRKAGKGKQRRTVIGVEAGEDVSKDEAGKVVWVFKGDEEYQRVKVKIPHPVKTIEYIPHSESFVAASDTCISVIDARLEVQTHEFAPTPSRSTRSSKTHPDLCRVHALGSAASSSTRRQLVLTYVDGSATSLIIGDLEGATIESKEQLNSVVLEEGEKVVESYLTGNRHLTLLTTTGRVIPSAISLDGAKPSQPPFVIAGNGETHAVVSPFETPSGPILVACDAQYLLLIHPTYPTVLTTTASPSSSPQAVVQLTANLIGVIGLHSDNKTSVHLVDVSLPSQGLGIAQMLETASLTKRFLQVEGQDAAPTSKVDRHAAQVRERDEALFEKLEAALKARLVGEESEAEKVWAEWLKEEQTIVTTQAAKSKAVQAIQSRSRSAFSKRVVGIVLGATLRQGPLAADSTNVDASANDSSSLSVPHIRTTGPNGAYARAVISGLIELGWLSDAMWQPQGVIIGGLLKLGDWPNIMLALSHFKTISSEVLVALLHHVLHPSTTTTTQSTISPPPSLPVLLRSYLAVPVSSSVHRAVLHAGLSVEDATRVLEVLAEWLEEETKWTGDELWTKGWEEMLISGSVGTVGDHHGGTKKSAKKGSGSGVGMPSLITHITLLLDSHLPLFLSHPPAHSLIAKLQSELTPLITSTTEITHAKGTIDAYLRQNGVSPQAHAHAQSVSGASLGAQQGQQVGGKGKKSQQQQQRGQTSSMYGAGAVGGTGGIKKQFGNVYTLEEVKL